MFQPKVVAVIPCHNHAQWINEAIDSILAQTYSCEGIVVVDDGSTDNSLEVLTRRFTEYQTGADNVFLGYIDNQMPMCVLRFDTAGGPSKARNEGIKRGWAADYFALLDSDDIYRPTKIEQSIHIFSQDPDNIGVVYSDYTTFNMEGLCIRQYKEPFSRQRLLQECIVNCDSVISKKAIQKCGLFDEQMRVCEDFDAWVRISEQFLICHIPESLVDIRVGSHSATSTVSNPIWQNNYRRVFEKMQERLQK